ncbi:hypothetical protein ACFQZE_06070 [Paenibacillus sp. GCM10027627]|uniref:hypothetical protein n=1 Tax=unclassified Paenibacillus TaxID=185978 RepID=UPI0036391C39
MLGTWRWNVAFGLLGIGLTVLFSIDSNPLTVTLLRSLYAFLAFFALGYAARLAAGIILKPPAIIAEPSSEEEQQDGGERGGQLDLRTPDEMDDLNDLLKQQLQGGTAESKEMEPVQMDAGFKPLSPPQFVSTTNKQPEELAKALRHLTGE